MSTIDLWGNTITLLMMVGMFGGMAIAYARARSATRKLKMPLLEASFDLDMDVDLEQKLTSHGILHGLQVSLDVIKNDVGHPTLVASVEAGLPLTMEIRPSKLANIDDLQLGDRAFDRRFDLNGDSSALVSLLSAPVRERFLEVAGDWKIEVSGGSVHVEPRDQTDAASIKASVRLAVELAKLLQLGSITEAEALGATAVNVDEPPTLRTLAARLLCSNRSTPDALLRPLLHAPDTESRLDAAALVTPMPLDVLLAIAGDGGASMVQRLKAVELIRRRVEGLDSSDMARFADLVAVSSGALLASVVQALVTKAYRIPLGTIIHRFNAVSLEPRNALLEAASLHGPAALSFFMDVLERWPLKHGPACVAFLAEHGTVALVERLAQQKGRHAAELILLLQANARGSDGGLALTEDADEGGLSEVLDDGHLAFAEESV